jgi:creatinine amidohydrolase
MLILGACEQHGYLSQATDVLIPQSLADAASQKTGVLVAPAVNFGVSPYFLDYAGTLSLRLTTLMDLVEDIIRSAYGQGFRRLLVLNGHGGNDGVRSRLYELANVLPDIRLAWYAWWQSHNVLAIAEKNELKPAHANWLEAFPFTIVSDLPQGEKTPPHIEGILGAEKARQAYRDGVFGGAYRADHSIMDEIFTAAVEDIRQLLKFE